MASSPSLRPLVLPSPLPADTPPVRHLWLFSSFLTRLSGFDLSITSLQSLLRLYILLLSALGSKLARRPLSSFKPLAALVALSWVSLIRKLIRSIQIFRPYLVQLSFNPFRNTFPPSSAFDRPLFPSTSSSPSPKQHSHTPTSLLTPPLSHSSLQDCRPDHHQGSSQLRQSLQSAHDLLRALVDVLDDLSCLNWFGIRCPFGSIIPVVSDLLSLISTLVACGLTSYDKADLWFLGRQTRMKMIQRQKAVKSYHLQVASQPHSDACKHVLGPPTDSIQNWFQLSSRQQHSIESRVIKQRNRVLKDCKRKLEKIWWMRVGLMSDAIFSVYDLLQLRCGLQPVRTIINCSTALIEFHAAYVDSIQEFTRPKDSA